MKYLLILFIVASVPLVTCGCAPTPVGETASQAMISATEPAKAMEPSPPPSTPTPAATDEPVATTIDTPTPAATEKPTLTATKEPTATATKEFTATDAGKPTATAADCTAAGLPEIACTGVSANDEWTPVIREFDGIPMTLVPAGCFTMGSTEEQIDYTVNELAGRRLALANEQPAHEQCFAEPFWIDLYEVTNGQYGSYDVRPGDDLPREYISWFDSLEHCESRGARLPTEAEWEYAARGPDSLIFPWGNEFNGRLLNYCDITCAAPWADARLDDGYPGTGPVGSYPGGASWVGALDMSGNVWEWTSGLLYEYPYHANDGREVDRDHDSSSLRTLRGGSYHGPPHAMRAANRNEHAPVDQTTIFGFRCARSFEPPASPAQRGAFVEHPVANDVKTASGLYVEDIDGDGDKDILAGDIFGEDFAWWRNDGGEPIVWTKQGIDNSFGGALYVYVADVDGDSDHDVLRTLGGEVAWWRNDGGEPIAWTRQVVREGLAEASAVFAADLDGDGDVDILGTDAGSDQVLWWKNDSPTGDGTRWVEQIIDDAFRYTQTAEAADLDGDGDLDVVAGAGEGNQIAWWRNEGGSPTVWTKQVIQTAFRWAHWVHGADVDGDGRLDVLGAAYADDTIAWWRNGGSDPIAWEKHNVDTSFPGVLTVYAADLDNDGDMDMLGTANNSSEIAWWRNDGGSPIQWKKQEIKAKTFGGAWGLHAGDLDGDGDIDVVGGGAGKILWWENRLAEPEAQPAL